MRQVLIPSRKSALGRNMRSIATRSGWLCQICCSITKPPGSADRPADKREALDDAPNRFAPRVDDEQHVTVDAADRANALLAIAAARIVGLERRARRRCALRGEIKGVFAKVLRARGAILRARRRAPRAPCAIPEHNRYYMLTKIAAGAKETGRDSSRV